MTQEAFDEMAETAQFKMTQAWEGWRRANQQYSQHVLRLSVKRHMAQKNESERADCSVCVRVSYSPQD
jgi:hypothetical protein